MREVALKLITTFFFVGYLPLIPGTFASLAALAVFFAVHNHPAIYLAVIIGLLVAGFVFCPQAERVFKKKDPRAVVIDEVAGMLLSLLFVPYSRPVLIWGFFFFRLLDTLKPYPAGRLEHLHSGAGIMADDLVAGLYTNLLLQTLSKLFG
jgi:phosphatidylglycerophosphatase A